jgi:RNA polymerase sigma factor (sigma-70 family)
MTAPETVGIQTFQQTDTVAEESAAIFLAEAELTASYDQTFENMTASVADEDAFEAMELEIALHEARQGSEEAAKFLLQSLAGVIIDGATLGGTFYGSRDDIVQNVHEKIVKYLIRKPEAFAGGSLKSYVHMIAQNAARDAIRKDTRRQANEYPEDERLDTIAAPESMKPLGTHNSLVNFLSKSDCSSERINLILMHHVYGYSYQEISDRTGVSLGTVQSRMSRGLEQVRKHWGLTKKGEDGSTSALGRIMIEKLSFSE